MAVDNNVAPEQWLARQIETSNPDVLWPMVKTMAEALMSAEADTLCAAVYGRRSSERTNSRRHLPLNLQKQDHAKIDSYTTSVDVTALATPNSSTNRRSDGSGLPRLYAPAAIRARSSAAICTHLGWSSLQLITDTIIGMTTLAVVWSCASRIDGAADSHWPAIALVRGLMTRFLPTGTPCWMSSLQVVSPGGSLFVANRMSKRYVSTHGLTVRSPHGKCAQSSHHALCWQLSRWFRTGGSAGDADRANERQAVRADRR